MPRQRLTDAEINANKRSRAARIASDASWARTPVRRERTAPGTKASPASYEYWVRRLTDEGVVCEDEIPAAAENAQRAYMSQLSAKAAAARRRKAAGRAA